MTEQQIIETLATKVMGWTEGFDFDFHSEDDRVYVHDMNGFKVIWNPLQNIADAWMIVEKLEGMGYGVETYVQKNVHTNAEPIHQVSLYTKEGFANRIKGSTICEAISMAAYKVAA